MVRTDQKEILYTDEEQLQKDLSTQTERIETIDEDQYKTWIATLLSNW